MQNRQLYIVNVALAFCALVLAWRLQAQWRTGHERTPQQAARDTGAPLFTPPGPLPLQNVSADEIVAKNLFTPDRTSARKQEAPVQAPPLPVVLGTMKLGDKYEALMSEANAAAAGRFRRVKTGEQFAGYTVAEIRDESVIVEFAGQKTTVNVYQSSRAAARNAPVAAPAPEPSASTTSVPAPVANPVIQSTGPEVPPTAANTFPAGSSARATNGKQPPAADVIPPDVKVSIEGNRKRFERATPFGPQVWYEELPQ